MLIIRASISVVMVLGMLSASSLPCAESSSSFGSLQRVESAGASGVHEGHSIAMNSGEHVHGASAPDRPRAEPTGSSVGRNESVYLTAPCFCGCQSGSSASSSSGTQLQIVVLPASPDLLARTVFEARIASSSPVLTKRFAVPGWTPI